METLHCTGLLCMDIPGSFEFFLAQELKSTPKTSQRPQLKKTALKFKYHSLMFFRNGGTALHEAAYYGHLDSCRLLVEARADLSLRDRCCSRLRARSLCRRAPHTQRCRNGKTALKRAIDGKEADVVAFLRVIGAPE